MIKKLISLFILMAAGMQSQAIAKVIFLQTSKINAPADIKEWAKSIKLKALNELTNFTNDKDGYTECRPTVERADVILCGTYLQRDMNAFLLRPTIYSEGGIGDHKKGMLVATSDKHISANKDVIAGHDITSKDLRNFYAEVDKQCSKGKIHYCLTSRETVFYHQVMQPLLQRNRPFVLIAFSVQSSSTPSQIVSHEFIHSVYFLDPKYKTRVNEFWNNQMTQPDRDAIKTTLKQIGYNANDETLMQNEFQAYMLMQDAEDSRLDRFVPKFRVTLRNYMRGNS